MQQIEKPSAAEGLLVLAYLFVVTLLGALIGDWFGGVLGVSAKATSILAGYGGASFMVAFCMIYSAVKRRS